MPKVLPVGVEVHSKEIGSAGLLLIKSQGSVLVETNKYSYVMHEYYI